jgi:signal transduction histidine kinase
VIVEPGPTAAEEARAEVAWIDGRAAEPFALPAAGLVRELLSGSRAFVPAGARDHHPADPLLARLRAEGFAAEPVVGDRGALLGFVGVADDRPFDPDTDVAAVLKVLAPRAAAEKGRAELEARLAAAERRAREAEAALRAAAHLATAGQIAAGVAHDFHNLLGVIAGNADLIREALPAGDPHRGTAEAIANAAHTVAGVSRKLLAVGRPGPASAAPLDVGAALRSLEPVLRRLAGRAVPIAFDLAPALPPVRADATQFDRVVLNLVLNARDAAARGGSVAVRAAAAAVEPGRPGWPADCAPGRYVALTVTDTGCGMPLEVRQRMFEMFFTTKGDCGTGLGLATVHEAVTAAGGHVEVESEVGWGTQVRVYWPALAEPPQLRTV